MQVITLTQLLMDILFDVFPVRLFTRNGHSFGMSPQEIDYRMPEWPANPRDLYETFKARFPSCMGGKLLSRTMIKQSAVASLRRSRGWYSHVNAETITKAGEEPLLVGSSKMKQNFKRSGV